MRQAVIEAKTGTVVNVIELEEGANWQPPVGHIVIPANGAGPDYIWDGAKFILPPVPVPLPDPGIAIAQAVTDIVAVMDNVFAARSTKLTDKEKTDLGDKIKLLVNKVH